MPEFLHTPAGASQHADADVRGCENAERGAGESGAESRRVRELPPPPRADVPSEPGRRIAAPDFRLRLPQIETDKSRPAPWRRWWSRLGRRQSSSCAVSFLFHFGLLWVLGLLIQVSLPESDFPGLLAYRDSPVPLDWAAGEYHSEVDLLQPPRFGAAVAASGSQREVPKLADPDWPPDPATSATNTAATPLSPQPAGATDWLLRSDTNVSGALRGRGRKGRALLVERDGGTRESERAVQWGLRWLMAHQRDDGSWNFDHHKSVCRGQCRNPGTEASTTAATAIALLPFLGAGYTHVEGEYQEVVQRGIYYLVRRTRVTPHGSDLQEGTMYAQGLSTIALCEAYAMTRDAALKDLAQGAIDFIVYAQDPKGGGWRYMPGQPGDTTVTGCYRFVDIQ